MKRARRYSLRIITRMPELCLCYTSHGYLMGFIIRLTLMDLAKPNQVMVDDSATVRVPVETPHSRLGDLSLKFWAGTLLILVELNIQKIPFFFV